MQIKTSHIKTILQGLIASILMIGFLSLELPVQARPSQAVNQPTIDAFQQVAPGSGWILFGGSLYWTVNDGGLWSDITPASDIQAVSFMDPSHGWVLDSSDTGWRLTSTVNGGSSWQHRPLDLPQIDRLEAPIAKVFMGWRTTSHGWLVFKLASGSNFSRGILYLTTDGGFSWELREVPLGEPIIFSDEMHGRLSGGPAGTQSFTTQDGGLTWTPAPETLNARDRDALVERSMSDSVNGWAKWQSGECTAGVCVQEVQLMVTRDGDTWTPLRLPNGMTSLNGDFSTKPKSAFADTDTIPYQGQGFDTCEIPSASKLQAWWNRSPYSAVNLYIGGISRACSNNALNAVFLSQLNAQGWRFIPTWVGPQAACATWYTHRMSFDPGVAYTQGVAEANSAVAVAQTLGLTESNGSGTVIYYDLETYDTTKPGCRNAANRFIDGWTDGLHALGNLAGVYGASSGSAVSDWWIDPNIRPDAVWIAEWFINYTYRPDATTLVTYVNDTYWPDHQRLRQYAGGHDETWGGQTINIDSNVLDGPLTVPNGTGGTSLPTAPFNPVPANEALVGRMNDTWLRWKTTGDTCSIHVWGNTLDVTTSTPCSLYNLGVQAPGKYYWQVTATNPLGSTTGPIWTLNVRPAPPTALIASPASATRVDLAWTASTDTVDNYLVFSDGVQVASVPGTSTSIQVGNLACNTSHEFFLKSVKDGIQSVASGHVTAATPSCAPVLTYPLNILVNSRQPTFTWEFVAEATRYQIQASTYSNFSTLNINTWVSAAAYTHPLPLQANKKYYWRVRAQGLFGRGDWGSSSFTTPNPPPAPLLLSPLNNILITDYTPRFDWRDVTPPSGTRLHHYQVQVAEDSGFTTLTLDQNTNISEFTPTTNLASNRSYYWRVRAVNTLGHSGSWSSKAVFRTVIRRPILLSPLNGSTLVELRPNFDWEDVAGATSYTIHFSTSSTFTSLLLKALTFTSNYTPSINLPANKTLYWRVRANGPNGPSLWSPRWSFTVGASP